jgi:methoxymalonate biosynthesis protein
VGQHPEEAVAAIAVVGAGVLGSGLAALAVGCGLDVVLVDCDRRAADTAAARVASHLRGARLTLRSTLAPAAGSLHVSDRLPDIGGASVVVESVPERLDVKAAVLAGVVAAVPPGTLIGSTTSGIPIDELAEHAGRPADLVGLHFMNPPLHIRTVEVVRGPRTGDAAMRAVAELLEALRCTPVVVGDGAGFVVNRVLQLMINEASRIVQEGQADPHAVDALFTGCLGHRSGPLATADLIGLDNVVDSLVVLHDRTGEHGYQPSALLREKVAAGHLGRKTGQGFFAYPEPL